MIWIEHVVRALTAAVERLVCLAGGSFVGDGSPADVLANPAVREVFLGTEVTTSLTRPAGRRAGPGGRASPAGALLEVRDLTVHHGQLRALSEVSLSVFAGDVYAIIGANGAGKSTLLRAIAGLHQPTSGSILLDGADIARLRPERRVAAGIGMVPEGRRLFPSLTRRGKPAGRPVARAAGAVDASSAFTSSSAGCAERRSPARRPAVRRRAASRRDRPGAGRQSAGAAAG